MKTYIVVWWGYLYGRAHLKFDEVFASSAQEAVDIIRSYEDFESIVEIAIACHESWH